MPNVTGWPGLEGKSLGQTFVEYRNNPDGEKFSKKNDWAYAIGNEPFTINLRYATTAPLKTDGKIDSSNGVQTKSTRVYTRNVYPFAIGEKDAVTGAYPVRALNSDEGKINIPALKIKNAEVLTGLENLRNDSDPDAPVNVYTTTGVLLMKNVTRAEAIEQLEPGIYLIGHEKVIIK
ncbi:MAG: hypothetical protein ACI30D_02990 [Muribaculaceae bacterium]